MNDLKFILFKRMLNCFMVMCAENETAIRQTDKNERDYHINKAYNWKHKGEYILGLIEEAENFFIRINNNFKPTDITVVEFRIIKSDGTNDIVDINGLFDLLNN